MQPPSTGNTDTLRHTISVHKNASSHDRMTAEIMTHPGPPVVSGKRYWRSAKGTNAVIVEHILHILKAEEGRSIYGRSLKLMRKVSNN